MKRRVAVFGGSFNPPHMAHLFVTVYALRCGEVDEVVIVPCFIHPFAKALAPYEQRWQMCERAFGWLPGVTLSNVEQQLGGESRTLRTLRHLAEQHPDWALRLIIGADVILEAPRWYGFDEIEKLAPPLVLGRSGVAIEGGPELPKLFPQISSTDIRKALSLNQLEHVRNLVPCEVLAYIQQHGLYGLPSQSQ